MFRRLERRLHRSAATPTTTPVSAPAAVHLNGVDCIVAGNEYLTAWNAGHLVDEISITVSNRLKTSLGVAYGARREVRLHRHLAECDPKLIKEVLCHELAHLVVFERFGRRVRPHGAEWKAFMRAAGYKPRATVSLAGLPIVFPSTWYQHQCPRCRASRPARRRMNGWRCARCLNLGLDGLLTIQKIDSQ